MDRVGIKAARSHVRAKNAKLSLAPSDNLNTGLPVVRFDQPCVKISGAVNYFREHMAVGDYLTQEGQSEMTWVGKGAARLGRSGRCDVADFEALCAGKDSRSGERLLVRDKGSNRRVCYFAQISPPKDVSVLHLVGGDERIAQWWQQAVAETLTEMEALVATRVRKDRQNTDRRTGTMLAAVVTHDANRALDPQLHTHVCLLNLTYDATEKRWKSVQPSAFYRHQGYLREVCYNKLAAHLLAGGYEIESGGRIGFSVKGFPAELREQFSKRRRAILAEARETGATTQDYLQAITARSRAPKQNVTAAQLRVGWEREAGGFLPALHDVIARAKRVKQKPLVMDAKEALRSAEAHVFERRCVVDDRLLVREALIAGRGRVGLPALNRAIGLRESSGELIRIDDEIASREGLEAESEIVSYVSRTKTNRPLGRAPASDGPSSDQSTAVAGILESRTRVVILQGDAGTGKTTCLREIVAGIERSGGSVFACAPSSTAADVLRHDLTASADTLQQLLTNESLQRTLTGRTLIVDEAGLVSVRQMRDLCRLAARNDHRLLLVGDTKQHTAIEAGDAFRCLQEFARVPVFHLTEIRRQRDPAYRRAVASLARGNLYESFRQFERLGAVLENASEDALRDAAASDYVATLQSGKTCLAISPVWEEIKAFSVTVRTQLRSLGRITGPERPTEVVSSLKLTLEEKRRPTTYRPGDVLTFYRDGAGFGKHESASVVRIENGELVLRDGDNRERHLDPRRAAGFDVGTAHRIDIASGDQVLIRANLKSSKLRNGDLAEISSFAPDGSFNLRDGRVIPAWFREFTHGYATTSHAAQGKTVDRGILLLGEAGLAAANLKQAYVSCSRFRESHSIYTTDKKAALEAMYRPGDRKLALEMTGGLPVPKRNWRVRWREVISRLGVAAAA